MFMYLSILYNPFSLIWDPDVLKKLVHPDHVFNVVGDYGPQEKPSAGYTCQIHDMSAHK